jgi:acyl-CoA synthetase (AMP-forming)/AMP-acid ligase II/thiamine pyrophosphate-dependent acetolactate synthase large subunit-like protein
MDTTTTAADALVQHLLLNGINVCFSNPGTTELHLVSSLTQNNQIRNILCLHENVATGCCIGYSLFSTVPPASLLHMSVGLSNGLSNLHNCKRSKASCIVIVGDHSTEHQYDQHLHNRNIDNIAKSVSKMVKHPTSSTALVRDCTDCLRSSMETPRGVATLIVPANVSWSSANRSMRPRKVNWKCPAICSEKTISHVLELFRRAKEQGRRRNILLLHGSETVINPQGLVAAAKIERATNCRRAIPCFNSRITKGPTLPKNISVPYFSEHQVEFFKEIDLVILINAKVPCAFFAHPEQELRPGWTLPNHCETYVAASEHEDGVDFLIRLANAMNAPALVPQSPLSSAKTAQQIMDGLQPNMLISPKSCSTIMSALCPDGFIMSNEGNTLGKSVTQSIEEYVHYDEIQVVGGSIGQGLPVAIGAAVACPDRKIIGIQADGSAMYTIQSLWSMAREKLNICIVILDNAAYNILDIEFERITGTFPNERTKPLFNLESTPNVGLDFVALARAQNVTGSRCNTIGEFRNQFAKAMSSNEPHLIHCVFRHSTQQPASLLHPITTTTPYIPHQSHSSFQPPHRFFTSQQNKPNVWRILVRAAKLWGNHPAIVSDSDDHELSTTITYDDLLKRSKLLGDFLKFRGIQQNDRVSILADNIAEVIIFHFACAYIGSIIVNINVRLVPRELEHIFNDSTPKIVVADNKYKNKLKETFNLLEEIKSKNKCDGTKPFVQAVVWINSCRNGLMKEDKVNSFPIREQFNFEDIIGDNSDDGADIVSDVNDANGVNSASGGESPLHLYYTSGTTGKPKGVILSHRALLDHALGAVAEFQMQKTDIWGHFAPLFHVADAFAVLAITLVGGIHVMQSEFKPFDTWKTMSRKSITMTNVAPTMLIGMMMIRKQKKKEFSLLDFSSLRMFSCGGSAIPDSVVSEFIAEFPSVEYFTSYGMTETCGKIAFSLRSKNNFGRPFMLIDVRVATTKDNVVFTSVAADGKQVGEVQVRGQTLFSGYWNNSVGTIASFTPDGEWFRTGDLAVLHGPHDFITIVDRVKDMIVVGGENVYTTEVENVLYSHPDVEEAAVFGIPDVLLGETVCAAVVLAKEQQIKLQGKQGESELASQLIKERLFTFSKLHLATYKVPTLFKFVPSLPKTSSGKIQRRLLRDKELSKIKPATSPIASETTEKSEGTENENTKKCEHSSGENIYSVEWETTPIQSSKKLPFHEDSVVFFLFNNRDRQQSDNDFMLEMQKKCQNNYPDVDYRESFGIDVRDAVHLQSSINNVKLTNRPLDLVLFVCDDHHELEGKREFKEIEQSLNLHYGYQMFHKIVSLVQNLMKNKELKKWT